MYMDELSPKSLEAIKSIVDTSVASAVKREVHIAVETAVKREVSAAVKLEIPGLRDDLTQMMDDKFRIFADVVKQEIQASEVRTDHKLEAMERRIIENTNSFMNDGVLPQVDDHEKRITRLETKPAI